MTLFLRIAGVTAVVLRGHMVESQSTFRHHFGIVFLHDLAELVIAGVVHILHRDDLDEICSPRHKDIGNFQVFPDVLDCLWPYAGALDAEPL